MSKRFTFNNQDLSKWSRNTVLFFAPAFLIFLLHLQTGKTLDEAGVAIQVWLISTLIDATRKFIAEGK